MAMTPRPESEYKNWQPERVEIIDDRDVRFSDICVHTFSVGDVEDPEIYAAQPIWEWQESDAGKWVMENAVEKPYYIQGPDYNSWGHRYKIMARLSEQNQTFWRLKWGGNNK